MYYPNLAGAQSRRDVDKRTSASPPRVSAGAGIELLFLRAECKFCALIISISSGEEVH